MSDQDNLKMGALAWEIRLERESQIQRGWTREHDDVEGGPLHLLVVLREHVRQAGHLEGAEQRHKLLIIGALALAALESFDHLAATTPPKEEE